MARVSASEHSAVLDGGFDPAPTDRLLELEQKVDNLLLALASQRMIGTAVGLLAERQGCPTSEGWQILTRMSQNSNRKVRDIARALVDGHDGALRPEDADLLASLNHRRSGSPQPERGAGA